MGRGITVPKIYQAIKYDWYKKAATAAFYKLTRDYLVYARGISESVV